MLLLKPQCLNLREQSSMLYMYRMMYFKDKISKWHVLDLVFQLQNIVQTFPKYFFVLWKKYVKRMMVCPQLHVIHFLVFSISITITKST